MVIQTFKQLIDAYNTSVGLNFKYSTFDKFFSDSKKAYPINSIIPGYIYTFDYNLPMPVVPDMLPANKEEADEWKANDINILTSKPYFDLKPVGMALRVSAPNIIVMLNFRALPNIYRMNFLSKYYQLINKVIEYSYHEVEVNGKTVIELKPLNVRLKDSRINSILSGVDITIINNILGLNLAMSVNIYNVSFIRDLSIIDWDDIAKLPYCNISNTDDTIVYNSNYSDMIDIYNKIYNT